MDIIQVLPRLRFIRFPAGHAYLWRDPGGLTLIDTGLPRSAPLIDGAIRQGGCQPTDLRRLVLAHFHADHIGAPADVADWGEVEVLAHHADAPFIRGGAAGPVLDLAGRRSWSTSGGAARGDGLDHPRCRPTVVRLGVTPSKTA